MGFGRFFDWVIGGRFQDALQWQAWLNDPTRYEIVGRLFLDNWGWFNLIIAIIGLALLGIRSWKTAVIQSLIFISYTFYCLNYYVPDLAVFLIPAQMMIGIWWGFAFKTGLERDDWGLEIGDWRLGKSAGLSLQPFFLFIFLIPLISNTVNHWKIIDQSSDDGRTRWGTAVLNQPLVENAAILADSAKFPPLFYLQQSEGIREDLDISVWSDEAAYRAQLDSRLAAGQTVYLARFLPGLEGIYHLNSVGPILHVSQTAQTALPATATPTEQQFGSITLRGFSIEPISEADELASAATFYWQTNTAVTSIQHVYVRWQGFEATAGQHPANNAYPTVAWKAAELVSDYHSWPYPILSASQEVALQVALAPPFTPESELAWQTIAMVNLEPNLAQQTERPLRIVLDNTAVTGITLAEKIRPQSDFTVFLSGFGQGEILFDLEKSVAPNFVPGLSFPTVSQTAILFSQQLDTDVENGRYHLVAKAENSAICGWMQPRSSHCSLGQIIISGVPLPEGATNFGDKIGLLNAEVTQTTLEPNGQLHLDLTWQGLASMDKNYTVFVQVLTEGDQIVGQIDSWPLQGTLPTSQWQTGEIINDPYIIQLAETLPPGSYKIQVGFYLLETLKRLPTLNAQGQPSGDFYLIQGLQVLDE